ncbi:MAG: hypothetical protein P4L71_01070 [Acetobacteraceae bacterium]|nr:hypothetical protein [Acetobacteraceae bacterium]
MALFLLLLPASAAQGHRMPLSGSAIAVSLSGMIPRSELPRHRGHAPAERPCCVSVSCKAQVSLPAAVAPVRYAMVGTAAFARPASPLPAGIGTAPDLPPPRG